MGQRVPYHCECGARHAKGKIWYSHYKRAKQFIINTKNFIAHHNEIRW